MHIISEFDRFLEPQGQNPINRLSHCQLCGDAFGEMNPGERKPVRVHQPDCNGHRLAPERVAGKIPFGDDPF